MGFNCGIVGLPNVGKSTLFNALTRMRAEVASYPFTTVKPNVGIVKVPDERLTKIYELLSPPKAVPTTIEFIDIAGLVKGASKGEGLGNQFLDHIRGVDAIVEVVRCFEANDVPHIEGSIDPIRDIETIKLELSLADLEIINRRHEKVERFIKTGDPKYKAEADSLRELEDIINRGELLRSLELNDEQERLLQDIPLLTVKPFIYVANLGEDDSDSPYLAEIENYASQEGSVCVPLYAKLEAELSELEEDEIGEFLKELGIEEASLERLIRVGYEQLDLITFYTTGDKEVRARTLKRGTKAPQAAGKVHSDMERGFIRAEVISYDDLVKTGSLVAAREKGLMRLEGHNYVVQDGDIIYFRFNV